MNSKSNYQDVLKTLAIICMIIDHYAFYFSPSLMSFRLIGRIAMPIFCFFVGYNYNSHKKPRIKLLLIGVLLLLLQLIRFKGEFQYLHIITLMYCGLWYIYLFKNKFNNFYTVYAHVVLISCFYFITAPWSEYGTFVISIILLGYAYRNGLVDLHFASIFSIALSAMHTICIFNFSMPYDLIYYCLCLILYLLFFIYKFEHPVSWKFGLVSRNSLAIYFFHLCLFESILIYRTI